MKFFIIFFFKYIYTGYTIQSGLFYHGALFDIKHADKIFMMQQRSKSIKNEKYLETCPYINGIKRVARHKTIVFTHKTHIYIDSYMRKEQIQ